MSTSRKMELFKVLCYVAFVTLALTQQRVCASSEQVNTKESTDDLEKYLNEIQVEKFLLDNLESENQLLDDLISEKQNGRDENVNNEDEDYNELEKRDGAKRNSNRRQQAARWDIGFGKRQANKNIKKQKPFMDALYGKRSQFFDSLYGKRTKIVHPKYSFGRRQQWDIQYGR